MQRACTPRFQLCYGSSSGGSCRRHPRLEVSCCWSKPAPRYCRTRRSRTRLRKCYPKPNAYKMLKIPLPINESKKEKFEIMNWTRNSAAIISTPKSTMKTGENTRKNLAPVMYCAMLRIPRIPAAIMSSLHQSGTYETMMLNTRMIFRQVSAPGIFLLRYYVIWDVASTSTTKHSRSYPLRYISTGGNLR